jgi:hypothetical protein
MIKNPKKSQKTLPLEHSANALGRFLALDFSASVLKLHRNGARRSCAILARFLFPIANVGI